MIEGYRSSLPQCGHGDDGEQEEDNNSRGRADIFAMNGDRGAG